MEIEPKRPTVEGPVDWSTGELWTVTHLTLTHGPPTWGDHVTHDDGI